jgi:hypothetical protein
MRGSVMLLLCSLACRPSGGATTTPTQPAEAQEATPEETNTYVSARPDDAEQSQAPKRADGDDGGAAPAVAGLAAKVDTIQAVRELVVAAAGSASGEHLLSPALVPTWPTKEPVLVFVVYPLAASKKGINAFKVGVPLEVKVDLIAGTTTKRTLKRGALMQDVKVERDSATVRQNLETAEQTLIELLLERRPVERSFVLLDGYREWFNHHLEMMTDLDKRMPDGVRWLRKPG